MARGRKSGKHSGSKPTSSRRAATQEIKERYSKAREDAQLAGLIPTTPEEAMSEERADRMTQFDPALPELVREALKDGWSVPHAAKPSIVAALLEPFYKDEVVFDEKGNAHSVKPSKKLLNELAKTLRMLDQTQYERDHPEEAGKAKGGRGETNVNVIQNNIEMAAIIKGMVERGEIGRLEEMRTSDQSSSLSYGRQQREVQSSTTPPHDEQCASEGVEDTK